MVFYHLSPDASLECICQSSTTRTPTIITPRIPEDCADEDKDTLRVCVAPSIWQCILSIPRYGHLHIYEFNAGSFTNPVILPDNVPCDFHFSGEQWITDNDIEVAGGQIELANRGYVVATGELKSRLDRVAKNESLSHLLATEDGIWLIQDQQWFLKFSPVVFGPDDDLLLPPTLFNSAGFDP